MLSKRFRTSFSANELIYRILAWASPDDPVCLLDNNGQNQFGYPNSQALIGIGATSEIKLYSTDASWKTLRKKMERNPGWWLGYLAYDLKNDAEKLQSQNPDYVDFPDLYFFQPAYLFQISSSELIIKSAFQAPELLWASIQNTPPIQREAVTSPIVHARISKKTYTNIIHEIKQHIKRGDIYEMNFCQEFYVLANRLSPLPLFRALKEISPSPFAAYLRRDSQHVICSSPERFLRKRDQILISQPIKGTRNRGLSLAEDERLRKELAQSRKDRSEHVMIVDLVRNDLARSCQTGSVQVTELYGLYSFSQVHQMISTIQGVLRSDVHFVQAIQKAFPMGSMTGAPKVKAMELIDQFESTRRGVYSGAIGYISPQGDFDFNVVIRSILLHEKTGYLSFSVGGAIVYESDPEQEYQECLWKIRAILEALGVHPNDIVFPQDN